MKIYLQSHQLTNGLLRKVGKANRIILLRINYFEDLDILMLIDNIEETSTCIF